MSVLAEKAAARLYEEEEISVELVFPLQVSPFRPRVVLESASATRKLLVVEEGAAGFDLGAEVIAAVATASRGAGIRYRRIAAVPVPIPSATTLEQQVLPDVDGIVAACLELFDE
jgi:2-oxoisovalerate dehydrogenase E1 component